MMAQTLDVKDQAMLLAQGYVQGQRDLLIQILEHRFAERLPNGLKTQLASLPAHSLGALGPLLVTAPDMDAVSAAADELIQGTVE
ncbi:MAG: hypothetical protein VYA30_06715 [Myxococcota bacterium]|nr:hypothetical protein [Myxococcota bacterium]